MAHARVTSIIASVCAVVSIAIALSVLGSGTLEATQAPKMKLDMVPAGNFYSDPGSGGENSMSVGTVQNCLTNLSDPDNDGIAGDNRVHNITVHLILQDVEDLADWQASLATDSTRIKFRSINYSPFTDTTPGPFGDAQGVSFLNLPIDSDSGYHRLVNGSSDYDPDPNLAKFWATYDQNSADPESKKRAISPDTPPKTPPDDNSYSAPAGGVLAALTLEVQAGQQGRSLSIFLDASAGGSKVDIVGGGGSITPEVSHGYYGNGVACDFATPTPVPTPPPPTPSPASPSSPLRPPALRIPAPSLLRPATPGSLIFRTR